MADAATHPAGLTTATWAQSFGISVAPTPPAVTGYDERCARDARQVAIRALVLHGTVAIASDVEPEPVIAWLSEQALWDAASPAERALASDPTGATRPHRMRFRWRQEAEWALLWVVGKVDNLGLPTRECDTRRLVDEIVPAFGADVEPFLTSVRLRSPGELLAETDRHYNLWCRYNQARRAGPHAIPTDLLPNVLFQREYAFEWLHGGEGWDDVQCDA